MAGAALLPQPYQRECFEHAVAQNTIVALPVGAGKTLVASMLIDEFASKQPDKFVVFVTPTSHLADQFAAYFERHCEECPKPVVLTRKDQPSTWSDRSVQHQPLVTSMGRFFQAVLDRHVIMSRVSLLVFDECHNLLGFQLQVRCSTCRMVGFTALPEKRRLKRKRAESDSMSMLEDLLQASVFPSAAIAPMLLRTVSVDDLLFTQDSCRVTFSCGRTLRQLVQELHTRKHDILTAPFLELEVIERNGKLYSNDNRRLYCLKRHREESGQPVYVRARVHVLTEAIQRFIKRGVGKGALRNGTERILLRGSY